MCRPAADPGLSATLNRALNPRWPSSRGHRQPTRSEPDASPRILTRWSALFGRTTALALLDGPGATRSPVPAGSC